MARKSSSGRQLGRIITVIHPNDSDIKAKYTRLGRVDSMEFFQEIRDSRPVRVIKDGDQVMRDAKGNPLTYTGSTDFPLDAVKKFLSKVYVEGSLEGWLDANGNPLTVTKDNIEELLDEELDIVPEDGDPYPYWMMVFREVTSREKFGDPNSQR